MLKDGILRIGVRIDRAPLPYETTHLIILPKCSVVSKLILADIHERLGHLGKGYVINDMRETYWIIGAGVLITTIMTKCVTCRKYRSQAN